MTLAVRIPPAPALFQAVASLDFDGLKSGFKLKELGSCYFGNFLALLLLIMRIIAKRTLRDYWERNPDAEQPLLDWHDLVITKAWLTPNDVKQTYGNASIIDANRVVFNIRGNDYWLITHIDYTFGFVFVLWVGRHSDYDKIDAKAIEFRRKTDR